MVRAKRDDGLLLGVLLQMIDEVSGKWQVLAIETPIPKAKKTVNRTQAVLDNHAHQLLGEFPIAQAFQVAEDYARQWLTQKGRDPVCACEDIAPKTKEKPPRRLSKKEIDQAVRTGMN